MILYKHKQNISKYLFGLASYYGIIYGCLNLTVLPETKNTYAETEDGDDQQGGE